MEEGHLPLDHIRILDLSWLLPYTTLLADFGADVIKIEEPTRGDYSRGLPPLVDGEGAAFLINHRNKKSMTLNLKFEKGKKIFYKLVEKSDVLVESFRPGVVKRLGVDYETVKKFNQKIIYCSVSGYGQNGPYKDLPGHDINYIAEAGILGLNKTSEGKFVIPDINIADLAACLYAPISILIALINREKTGRGQYIDLSIFDSAVSLLSLPASAYFATGFEGFPFKGLPHYNIYQTKDEKYITLGILEERFWRNLCKVLDKEEMTKDIFPTGKRRKEIFSLFEKTFKTRDRDEWFTLLKDADVPCGSVHTLDEVFSDPQVLYREMVIEVEHPKIGRIKQIGNPIKFSDTPAKIRLSPPLLGQNTEEILREMGYTEKEIKEFRNANVI